MEQSLFPKMTTSDIYRWLNSSIPRTPLAEIKDSGYHFLLLSAAIARGYQVTVYDLLADKKVFELSARDLDLCKKAAHQAVETLVGAPVELHWKEPS